MNEIIKNLKSDEKIVAIIRKYFLSLFKDIFFSLFLFILSFTSLYFILQIQNNEVFKNVSLVLFGFCLLLAIFFAVKTFFIWTFDSLVVTNYRIFDITQKSIFDKKITEINLRDIKSISFTKNGIIKTIFNFGDLKIETENSTTNLEITNIKDPFDIQQLINDRKEKLIQTEGQKGKFDNLSEEELIGLAYKLKEKIGSERLNNILKN